MMFERFTDRARTAVARSRVEARELGHDRVGTEHLLLALLRIEGGIAYNVLRDAGVEYAAVRDGVEQTRRDARALGEADAAALRTIGIDLDTVRATLQEAFGADVLDEPEPEPARRIGLFRRRRRDRSPYSPGVKKALALSLREALRLKHNYIGTEHLLLGLIRDDRTLAAVILTRAGVDLHDLRRRIALAVPA